MQLSFTEEAVKFIKQKFGSIPPYILLDYLDGDSPYNDKAIGCQLYDDFRLIFFHELVPEVHWDFYDLTLSTELGNVVLKSKYTMFLDSHTTIDYAPNYLSLTMRGNSGILVPRLSYLIK